MEKVITKKKKNQVKTVRKIVNEYEIDKKFSLSDICKELGILENSVGSKKVAISRVLSEKVVSGEIKRLSHGNYCKVKNMDQKQIEKESSFDSEQFIIYRGTIYESEELFCEHFEIRRSQLKTAIDIGYFRKVIIFKTPKKTTVKVHGKKMLLAEYYRDMFKNANETEDE